ncbi:MAG: amidohydrolase family protein [Planctomycetota bacterium]
MHESLDPTLAAALAEPLGPPPVPIFDIHMHSGTPDATADYVTAARLYGVDRACNLPLGGLSEAMTDRFGNFFLPCAWPRVDKTSADAIDWGHFHSTWIDAFERLLDGGIRYFKFKFVPPDGGAGGLWLDDGRIAPLLERCAAHGILVQVHAAQPDAWWPGRYDPAVCGPKQAYLDQLERVLVNHPTLKVLSVHMGSNPEHLDELARLMDTYPGYHVDTSATKWVVRELSAKPDQARAFFLRYADRICFGSDLVVRDGLEVTYYTSRFHVQRRMWETDARTRSMIRDPDAPPDGPHLRGLALPEDVLVKLYRTNAQRLLGTR